MKYITVWFTVMTVTFVTICDAKETSHWLAVLLGLYLFLTPAVYINFFWLPIIKFYVRKFAFCVCPIIYGHQFIHPSYLSMCAWINRNKHKKEARNVIYVGYLTSNENSINAKRKKVYALNIEITWLLHFCIKPALFLSFVDPENAWKIHAFSITPFLKATTRNIVSFL